MEWYGKAISRYFDFSGRARRKEYWFFALFYALFSMLANIIDYSIGTVDLQTGIGALGALVLLFHLIPSISAAVRRMHDRGWSAWLLLLCLIPGVVLIFFILFMFEGEQGENKYGPDPLADERGPRPGVHTAPAQSQMHAATSMPAEATAVTSSDDERLEKLRKLGDLREKGVLSEDEFAVAKADVMRGRSIGS